MRYKLTEPLDQKIVKEGVKLIISILIESIRTKFQPIRSRLAACRANSLQSHGTNLRKESESKEIDTTKGK